VYNLVQKNEILKFLLQFLERTQFFGDISVQDGVRDGHWSKYNPFLYLSRHYEVGCSL
jgi:hypothetical protein